MEDAPIKRQKGGPQPGSGRPKGKRNAATLERDAIAKAMDQRYMALADKIVNAQATLALGQTFLYKIEKEWRTTGKKNKDGSMVGYWFNKAPKQVSTQWEIEKYLGEIAENNGDLSPDREEGDTYYFLTAKEPNNQALDSIINRFRGKPKETIDVNTTTTFKPKEDEKTMAEKALDVILNG